MFGLEKHFFHENIYRGLNNIMLVIQCNMDSHAAFGLLLLSAKWRLATRHTISSLIFNHCLILVCAHHKLRDTKKNT